MHIFLCFEFDIVQLEDEPILLLACLLLLLLFFGQTYLLFIQPYIVIFFSIFQARDSAFCYKVMFSEEEFSTFKSNLKIFT